MNMAERKSINLYSVPYIELGLMQRFFSLVLSSDQLGKKALSDRSSSSHII